MVISYTKNFIFLSVPKNASSSLTTYFASLCDPKVDKWTFLPDAGKQQNNVSKYIKLKYPKFRYLHLTLQEILEEEFITLEQAHQMKKIAVIRNPIHRQLSLYFWICKTESKKISVESFRKEFKNGRHEKNVNDVYTQSDYLKIDNQIAPNVNFIKYEELEKKYPNIPRYKSGIRPNIDINELADLYYDETTKKAVLDYFEEDMRLYSTL
jgi:hypothetical protein